MNNNHAIIVDSQNLFFFIFNFSNLVSIPECLLIFKNPSKYKKYHPLFTSKQVFKSLPHINSLKALLLAENDNYFPYLSYLFPESELPQTLLFANEVELL